MKPRIYIDTSVIGGCYDKEFEKWSILLMNEFILGQKIAVISDLTIRELEFAPEEVRLKLDEIPKQHRDEVITGYDAEVLADFYIKEGAVTRKFYEDAVHIANATIQNVNVLASWNFRHIVNLERIRKYNAVNLVYGYKQLEIRTPREIINLGNNEN